MPVATSQFYIRFCFGDFAQSGRSKSTCICANFNDNSLSMAEILLLPVSENKRRHVEFYSRFRFSSSHHHRHDTLHQPTKLCLNQTTGNPVMTSYPFSRRRPRHRNSTSAFVRGDFAQLGKAEIYIRQDLSIHS